MALILKLAGGLMTLVTIVFIGLTFLAATGSYNPYPAPPAAAAGLPHFGRSANLPFSAAKRRSGESMGAYERRLTLTVNAWMIHYWPDDRRYVEINPVVDLALWLKSWTPGYAYFGDYEFITPELAWNRGYGYCSQVSRILYSMLRREGAAPAIMTHANHVVVEVDGTILDSDYGVVIPHPLSYMQANPKAVETYYADFKPNWPLLEQIYAEGFRQTATDAAFAGGLRYEEEATKLSWCALLAALWLSIAIADAGFCWDRFVSDLRSRPAPKHSVRQAGIVHG